MSNSSTAKVSVISLLHAFLPWYDLRVLSKIALLKILLARQLSSIADLYALHVLMSGGVKERTVSNACDGLLIKFFSLFLSIFE